MDLDSRLALIAALIIAIVELYDSLPPKGRILLGSFVTALISGMIIGLVYVSTRPDDYANALNQAKVLVPILIIGITIVAYFIMWRFQVQLQKQYIEKQFVTVRSLIRGHHYPQAQDILAKINNPKAREWEAKIHDQSLQDSDLLKQLQ